MKSKILKYLKICVCLILISSLVVPSYATLSASDGSSFVTKAEFDSALAEVNTRLTTFEAGINSKIDSQVTSYLDRNGIWSAKEQDVDPNSNATWFACGASSTTSSEYTAVNITIGSADLSTVTRNCYPTAAYACNNTSNILLHNFTKSGLAKFRMGFKSVLHESSGTAFRDYVNNGLIKFSTFPTEVYSSGGAAFYWGGSSYANNGIFVNANVALKAVSSSGVVGESLFSTFDEFKAYARPHGSSQNYSYVYPPNKTGSEQYVYSFVKKGDNIRWQTKILNSTINNVGCWSSTTAIAQAYGILECSVY